MAPPLRARATEAIGEAFTARLGYKIAALFFAVALWVVASGEETAEHYVPVRFEPTVDHAVRLDGDVPQMRALVSGPTKQLLKLYHDPPTVRRAFGPATPADMTLELRTSDVDLPSGADRVAVRDVEPRVIALHFRPAIAGVTP